eukprot:scaffold2705_cov109-Isochrysis_galbana.AAC.14
MSDHDAQSAFEARVAKLADELMAAHGRQAQIRAPPLRHHHPTTQVNAQEHEDRPAPSTRGLHDSLIQK